LACGGSADFEHNSGSGSLMPADHRRFGLPGRPRRCLNTIGTGRSAKRKSRCRSRWSNSHLRPATTAATSFAR